MKMKRVIIERTRNVTRLRDIFHFLKGRAVTFEAYSLFFRKKNASKQKQRHRFTEELSKLMVLY